MELKQGDLENRVLNALWLMAEDGQTQAYVGDVLDRICTPQRSWAYTTVKTVLDRLVDKGLLTREREQKKFKYTVEASRSAQGEQAVTKLIAQYFQGDVEALLACVARLRSAHGDTFAQPLPMSQPALVTEEAAPVLTSPSSRPTVQPSALVDDGLGHEFHQHVQQRQQLATAAKAKPHFFEGVATYHSTTTKRNKPSVVGASPAPLLIGASPNALSLAETYRQQRRHQELPVLIGG
jgi:predicted transcriptional regulator